MTTSTKEIDFPGEDEAAGTTGTATVEAATAPPAEPGVAPAEQPDCPPPPVTHQHPDGTTHVGIECSGGCPKKQGA